jgi:aminotransferase
LLIITAGSTGAFEIVCEAMLAPGDEVVTFTPFYPYHRNTLKRRGATIKFVELAGDQWTFSAEALDRAITPTTKFILLTNPGNPTGKVFSRAELEQIAEVARKRDVLVVSDEVYEYLTYDGREHISVATLPGMAERTLTMGSYSKTFAITGWRIGYLLPPAQLHDTLKIINDQMFICAPAPLQHGVAHGIQVLPESFYSGQRVKYSHKRATLTDALLAAGLNPVVPQGAYYIVAATSQRYPGRTSGEVAQLLVDQIGVAGVPASDFLGPQVEHDPERSTFLRFSFSVPDDALEDASRRLRRL